MHYGEYLRQLLAEKGVKLTELKDKIDIKSRNELYRLFENSHSYEKAKELIGKIVEAVDFTENEKAIIYSEIEKCNVKKSVLKSREILSGIYNGEIYKTDDKFYKDFCSDVIDKSTKGEIYVRGICDEKLIGVLHKLLMECPNIKIYHFVTFSGKEDAVAAEMTAMIVLSVFENYNMYTVSKTEGTGITALVVKNSKKYMCATRNSGRNVKFLHTHISTGLYDFIREDFECSMVHPVKERSDKLSDYAKELNHWTQQYMNVSTIIAGGFHLCMVPFDILYNIFKETGFFGLPEESEFTQDIINAYKSRCKFEGDCKYEKRVIFETEKIEKFMEDGKATDHVYCFRAMTKQERIKCIKEFTELCEKSKGMKKFRFIKGEVRRQFSSFKGAGVSTFNPDLGYGRGHYQVNVTKAGAREVSDDFAEYMWKNKTYDDVQSLQIIKNIIKKAEKRYEDDI